MHHQRTGARLVPISPPPQIALPTPPTSIIRELSPGRYPPLSERTSSANYRSLSIDPKDALSSTEMKRQKSVDSFGNAGTTNLNTVNARSNFSSTPPQEEDELSDFDDDHDLDSYPDDETERAYHGSAATFEDDDALVQRRAASSASAAVDSTKPVDIRNVDFPAPPSRGLVASNPVKDRALERGGVERMASPVSHNYQRRHDTCDTPFGTRSRADLGSSQLQRGSSNQGHSTPLLRNGSNQTHSAHKSGAFLSEDPDLAPGFRRAPRAESVHSRSSDGRGDFYRRTGAKTDLDFWEPSNRNAHTKLKPDHGTIANLPDWSSMRGTDLTSFPISHVQRDVEYSIMRLVSPALFQELLADPLGLHRFREFLNSTGATETSRDLDLMMDLREHIIATRNLRQGSEALHSVYVRDPETRADLPDELGRALVNSLRSTFALQDQLDGVHSHLVQTLFNSAFQRFIQASITENSRVRLGTLASGADGDGLGAAFVLTNPRLRDHPIVLVSPGFCELTGYDLQSIALRNCRFLQGPSTSPGAVQRIRDALNTGGSSLELLLNYRKNGEPFWNLLSITPLRDAKGRVAYFVGGQIDVTGSLTTKGLSFLLGGGRSYENLPKIEGKKFNGVEASPTMCKYFSDSLADMDHSDDPGRRGFETPPGMGTRRNRTAAGAQRSGSGDQQPSRAVNAVSSPALANDPIFGDDGPGSKQQGLGSALGSVGGSGLMKRLFNRRPAGPSTQLLGRTVENEARRTGGTLEEHMDEFGTTYGRLALVKREKREILFVTPALLEYFDLPVQTPQQLHDSSLLHADLLSLICGGDRNETKRLRTDVGHAIRTGRTLKVEVQIRQPKVGMFGSSAVLKRSVLHVSPLKDIESTPSATIVVFA